MSGADTPGVALTARLLEGVAQVPQADWDRLVGAGSPFMEWRFLRACELDSATPARGVLPRHLSLWAGERLVAALPLYVKGDGRAEFIYDWHWYRFACHAGLEYYPKLVSMSPFTPVTGPHLLVDPALEPADLLPTLAELAEGWAREAGLQGVHYLFLPEAEADALEAQGCLRRLTFQPMWHNAGYASLDAFLARFRSKDRVKIKRERRRVAEAGIRLEVRRGAAIEPADLDAMHAFYARTCRLYGTGSDYLQPETWEELFTHWRERLVVFLAWAGDERVGGSLCVHKGQALYGRYWGSSVDVASLYFELSYYAPIELCIAEGWERFYAGSGNSRYKYARGLDPTPVHSAHRLFDPRLRDALAAHLEDDRRETQAALDAQQGRSKLKGGA